MSTEWASDLVIEEILAEFPDRIAERRARLADPEWCAQHPDIARSLHDPVHMRKVVEVLREHANPFSDVNMAHHVAELEARMREADPAGLAGRASVADLN